MELGMNHIIDLSCGAEEAGKVVGEGHCFGKGHSEVLIVGDSYPLKRFPSVDPVFSLSRHLSFIN